MMTTLAGLFLVSILIPVQAFAPNGYKSARISLDATKKGADEAESALNKVFDFLSGNAGVRASKLMEPSLYNRPPTKVSGKFSKISKKLSSNGEKALAIYKAAYKNPRKGGDFDLTDDILSQRFNALASIVKDDAVVLQIVKNVPGALAITPDRCADNFAIFSAKFGFEGAVGLVTRNPNILSVPTTGYGSAEVAGDETIAISYLINYSRPVGSLGILILILLVCKPFLATLIN